MLSIFSSCKHPHYIPHIILSQIFKCSLHFHIFLSMNALCVVCSQNIKYLVQHYVILETSDVSLTVA